MVVDEIISPFQLPAIIKLLSQNKKVAVASHLNPAWFKILCPFTPTLSFRTDASAEKIRRYLIRKRFHILQSLFCLFVKPMGPIMSTFNAFWKITPVKVLMMH